MKHVPQPVWALLLLLVPLTAPAADPSSRTAQWLLDAPAPHPVEPPTSDRIRQSIRSGIDFLLQRQNPNGSWGSATNTKDLNIFAPCPVHTMPFAPPSLDCACRR